MILEILIQGGEHVPAAAEKAKDWVDLVERIGIAWTIIGLMALGIYKATKALWAWFKPHSDAIVKGHISFMELMSTNQTAQTELMRKSNLVLDAVHAHVTKAEDRTDHWNDSFKRIEDKVEQVGDKTIEELLRELRRKRDET